MSSLASARTFYFHTLRFVLFSHYVCSMGQVKSHVWVCVCERVNIVGIWKLYVCAYILSHWNKCEISNKCFETHEYLYIDWRDNCICFRTQWISVAQQWCPVVVKYAHFKTTFTALFSLSALYKWSQQLLQQQHQQTKGGKSMRKMKICSLQLAGAKNDYLFF